MGEKYEMLKYTTRYVNIVSLLITIIIFISINLITPLFNKINKYPISILIKIHKDKTVYLEAQEKIMIEYKLAAIMKNIL